MGFALRAMAPSMTVLAPARAWNMSRAEEIEYARARDIPIPIKAASPYNIDSNLWGRSIQYGPIDDAWAEPPEAIYALTRSPQGSPDEPAYVEIDFEGGVPVRTNGVEMPLVELVESLETIAGAHGVGRIDMVENRLLGIKSREIHEAPAAVVLHAAHRDLQAFVTTRELDRIARHLGAAYGDLVYNGLWFTDARRAMDAFVAAVQQRVTGDVRVKLFRGDCQVVGRRSPYAVYDPGLSTYGDGDRFDHSAAEGFIRIWGLPFETSARTAAGAGRPASTRAE